MPQLYKKNSLFSVRTSQRTETQPLWSYRWHTNQYWL